MNSGPLVFLGIFVTLASSFWGLLLVPQVKIGRQQLVTNNVTGQLYPVARSGQPKQGEEVYRSLGCAECHTRQVRPRAFGTDFDRGWGPRRTVAQDYVQDYPVMLGNLRVGPDLANIGLRQTNALWHLIHLYAPKRMAPGSMMPPYRFLFRNRKLNPGEKPPPEALPFELEPGYATIPSEEAHALVAYLLSQQAEAALFEAPYPGAATNLVSAASASTNAVSTNAAAVSTNTAATNATNLPAAPSPK